VDGTAVTTGNSSLPAGTLATPRPNGMVYAGLGAKVSYTVAEKPLWSTHSSLMTNCGGAWGSATSHGVYGLHGYSTSASYDVYIGGTARPWALAMVAYRVA
jgi:hypothetical protein